MERMENGVVPFLDQVNRADHGVGVHLDDFLDYLANLADAAGNVVDVAPLDVVA